MGPCPIWPLHHDGCRGAAQTPGSCFAHAPRNGGTQVNEHASEGAGGAGAGTCGRYGASLPGLKGAGSPSRVGLGAAQLCGVLALLVGLTGALSAPAAGQSSRTPTLAGDAAATPGSAWSIRPTPDQTVPNGALLSSSCTSATAC